MVRRESGLHAARHGRAFRLFAAAGLCNSALAANPELLEEAEAAEPPKYPKVFPRGVLNPAWANDRQLLRRARPALRSGRPVVIPDFLAPPVAAGLADYLRRIASSQEDGAEGPFQRRSEGPSKGTPKRWAARKPQPCERILEDFTVKRNRRFSFVGHIMSGHANDKYNAWYHGFRDAMQQPAVQRFWRSLADLPGHASAYDSSWSWLRPGDFYGLHADDAQMRYLAVTVHLARDWPADGGGEFVWCGPDGTDDVLVESPDRPHFHKTFNVSRNGTTLAPGFNTAVVFPVFRSSYHAVAPVLEKGHARRFTLQGWYVDPCHYKPPHDACVKEAMRRLQDWSEKRAGRALVSQPPLRVKTPPLSFEHSEL